LGQAAHIRGERPEAARYDINMTDAQRDAVDNLIYLCPTHHVVIDAQRAAYPSVDLYRMKANHEARMAAAQLRAAVETIAQVGFAELKVLLDGIIEATQNSTSDLSLVPLEEKLQINLLSAITRQKVALGLARANDVGAYLQGPGVPSGASETVVARFKDEYRRLRSDGYDPDAIFDALHIFASLGSVEIRYQTAGLAVVVYLFERCEIFETAA
jgi:hypothetical protein